ncbi:MAG: methyltransferase domain-containing protein [bacterium]|nr:methyltransferase domain-containing protein [bacterium]
MTETSENEIYSAFAGIYDDVMRDVDYDSWAEHIIRLAKKFKINVTSVLEIACGTGVMTANLAERGYRVTGVDISPGMLAIARKRLTETRVKAQLLHGSMDDLAALRLEPGYDLAICLYDSLNYLLDETSVARAFEDVFALLRPGGGYIFDVTTEYNLMHNFAGYTFAENFEDASYIWENEYDIVNKICASKVSIFKRGDRGYEKFVEVHRQRVYPNSWLKDRLQDAGFEMLGTFFNMTEKPVSAKCERIHFVCRKPK